MDLGEAVWTGDGFRFVYHGEGGAGYRSAQALFMLYGIKRLLWEKINFDELYELKEEEIEGFLFLVASGVLERLSTGDFVCIADKKPYYLRVMR